jgi:hypothetical protein
MKENSIYIKIDNSKQKEKRKNRVKIKKHLDKLPVFFDHL